MSNEKLEKEEEVNQLGFPKSTEEVVENSSTEQSESSFEESGLEFLEEEEDRSSGLNFDLPPIKTPDDEKKVLFNIREEFEKKGLIGISAYVKKGENMGLENYGMVLFPGTAQRITMATVTQRGITKYVNGLDEYAPSVLGIENKEEREAAILRIRTIVAQLEREQAYNSVDVKDPDFWSKVKTYRPDNAEVWSNLHIDLTNNTQYLHVNKDVNALLKYLAIEANGYPEIAPSYDDVRSGHRNRKWFLDIVDETIDVKTTVNRIKNQAGGKLEYLMENASRTLFYIVKMVDPRAMSVSYATSPTALYKSVDEYISGEGSEKSVRKACETFLKLSETTVKELKIRAMIKDADRLRLFVSKDDRQIYYAPEGIMMGRNMADVYNFLITPTNSDVLEKVREAVEAYWKK